MKETLTTIIVLIAVFLAGWFINGKRTDQQWRQKLGTSPVVFQYFEWYVDVPVPVTPLPVTGKPSKDTSGTVHALDSLRLIYQDSLALQQRLAQPFTGTHKDTGIYLQIRAFPVTQSFVIDSLWLHPVRCDSVVATKVVVDTVKQYASIRTAASVSIGAAAGAKIGGVPGAAIGSLAGLVFDWLF